MAIDIDQSHYSTGTATVSGVNVTGFGTTFTVLRKGDQWGTHKGFGVRIAGITDDTHLTLAYDVPALQQTAAPFEVQRTPYDLGYLQAIEDIIDLMGEGALPSLAAVDGTGGDKLIKLIGPNTAEAFDGKRVINIAALTGAGVIEFDALGNAALVPKADLITGVDTDGKANSIAERDEKFGAQAAGFTVLVADIGVLPKRSAIYFKNTATLNDWSIPALLTGETGQAGPFTEITFGPVTTVPASTPASANVVVVDADTIRIDLSIPTGKDGTGTGDMKGPASSVDAHIAVFDGATGKLLKGGGRTISELIDPWATQPIGVPIAVWTQFAGATQPPTDQAYRYVKLTASDAYNAGVLTGENISGSAPLVIATAVVSLAGSPISGVTVSLINTERRVLRAGSTGVAEQDALQGHLHYRNTSASNELANITAGGPYLDPAGGGSRNLLGYSTTGGAVTDGANGTPRTAIETRAKSIGATYYMRVK